MLSHKYNAFAGPLTEAKVQKYPIKYQNKKAVSISYKKLLSVKFLYLHERNISMRIALSLSAIDEAYVKNALLMKRLNLP